MTRNSGWSWKTSLRLHPDGSIQAYLDRAEREMKQEAERELSYRPARQFTDQAHIDLTQAPAWTGGNDGKLRIPIHGVDSLNSESARILKQELAHWFINRRVQRTMSSGAA